jgi:hypothetical protein
MSRSAHNLFDLLAGTRWQKSEPVEQPIT